MSKQVGHQRGAKFRDLQERGCNRKDLEEDRWYYYYEIENAKEGVGVGHLSTFQVIKVEGHELRQS